MNFDEPVWNINLGHQSIITNSKEHTQHLTRRIASMESKIPDVFSINRNGVDAWIKRINNLIECSRYVSSIFWETLRKVNLKSAFMWKNGWKYHRYILYIKLVYNTRIDRWKSRGNFQKYGNLKKKKTMKNSPMYIYIYIHIW